MRRDERLEKVLRPTVEGLGCELWGLEYNASSAQRGGLLRIYIDAPQGVTVEDCERVSRQVGALLDVEDVIAGSYMLEVSSPGADRLLFEPAHFERFVGERVRLRLRVAQADGARRVAGQLSSADGEAVTVVQDDGIERRLLYSEIEKARLDPRQPVGLDRS